MSSGISIDEGRLKPAPTVNEGFQAWHFFVLASILLATVSVFLTRRSSPEHLILLSFTVAAAGAVAAALYRMLLPLVSSNPVIVDEPLTERRRATLERDKMLALRAIKDLEFDRAMGKVSQKDVDEMAMRLRQRAVTLMRQLDQGAGYGALIERDLQERLKGRLKPAATVAFTEPALCACGTVNDGDAAFCKKCGMRLQAA